MFVGIGCVYSCHT